MTPEIVETKADTASRSWDWTEQDLYRFFAFVLAPPSPERFRLLSQVELQSAFLSLWQHLGCRGEFPELEWFANYQQYEATYIALFDVGIPEPPVPLFESAHDKRHPAQEIALENTYFYEVLGLRTDPNRAVPDYLITQLEFLSAIRYTYENATDEVTGMSLARAEREFLERHLLNWVPKAAHKLRKTNAPGFAIVMDMLVQFLAQEYKRSDEESPSV